MANFATMNRGYIKVKCKGDNTGCIRGTYRCVCMADFANKNGGDIKGNYNSDNTA
jgi:hypothetical protein